MPHLKKSNSILFKIISYLIGLLLFFHFENVMGQVFISNQNKINSFSCPNFASNVCVPKSGIVELDSFSVEGIKGFWTPQLINIDTINGNRFSSIWKAIDISPLCANDTLVQFEYFLPKKIDFNIPNLLCKKFGIYPLPLFSLDSISGKWNIARINTDTLPLGILNLTFVANSNCIDTFNTNVEIADFIYPQFNIKTKVCISEAPFDLPLVSEDGVTGIWTERTIIPSIIGSSFVSIFTPDIAFRDCYLPVAVTFEVYTKLKPEFSLPDKVCFSDPYFDFVSVSDNNVAGTWGIPNIDNSVINSPVLRNTFVPNNFQCHEVLVIEIPVITFSYLSLTIQEPSNCGVDDGAIAILNAKSTDEFSKDKGNSWQSIPVFNNLSSGKYTIHVRSTENIFCVDSLEAEITEPASPIILSTQINDLTDCLIDNGSALCMASGDNLEFSIDNLTWQNNPVFENLAAGSYTLYARNRLKDKCIASTTFEIDPAQLPFISDISITDLTSCTSDDGRININAIGQGLIFSIDNGNTFQQSQLFDSITRGNYQVVVSSSLLSNCFIDTVITISSPAMPKIVEIIAEQPSDCGLDDGKIMLIADGPFLEYSIDNGMNWGIDSVFTDLATGSYQIVIRNKNSIDCYINEIVTIDSLKHPNILDIKINQPTTCISMDGKIEIETDIVNTEFSIDNALSWSIANNLQNLSGGAYQLIARVSNTNSCLDSINFEIIEPPCPCLDLELDFDVKFVHCQDSLSGSIKINEIIGFFTNEAYTFNWCDSAFGSFEINDLGEGWYCYNIDYDRNCTTKDSIYVGTVPPIQFDLIGTSETCKDLASIKVENLTGGSGNYQYSLEGSFFQSIPIFENLYSQSVEVIVRDSLGCTAQKEILIEKFDTLALELPQIQAIPYGGFAILVPEINTSRIDSFDWSPKAHINNPGQLDANVSPPTTQEYTLNIYYGSCMATKTVVVEVLPSEEVFYPNILFLGSSIGNNLFYLKTDPENDTYIEYIKIFDRWGNMVFQKDKAQINNADEAWDGTLNTQPVESGVYYFVSELKVNGNIKHLKGTINIIR